MMASTIKGKVRFVFTIAVALAMVLPLGMIVVGEDNRGRDYYFVQFDESPTPSMLDEIIAMDGVILQYYHTYRYLINIDNAKVDDVTALPFVTGTEFYSSFHKLSDDVNGLTGDVKFRVELHDGVDVEMVSDRLIGLGAEITQVNTGGVNYIKCIVDSSLLEYITSIKEVSWIQQEFEPQTLMNLIQTPAYQGQDVPQFLDLYAGDGVLTEVQDNGIQLIHQDLQNVQWTDGAVLVASHGTCVSGIMFGQGIGDPEAEGIQYEGTGAFAQWNTGNYLTIDNLWNGNFNEAGSPSMPSLTQTNSWWSGAALTGQYNGLSNEIDRAQVDFPHILIHWACGNSNSGTGEGQLICESMSKNCISGGAIFHNDNPDMSTHEWHNSGNGMTPSRGPAADGRVKPDLCGPFDDIKTTDLGGYTNTFGGTSGATPTIAGSSGLTYDMYQGNFFGNNLFGDWPYASTVKALMIADAQQYPIDPSGSMITRNVQGWGTPDMENMYNLGSEYHVIEEYPLALIDGSSWGRTVSVDGTKPLKVTLVWTDPAAPSGTGSGRALINNLDLKLTSPIGTEYFGNLGLGDDIWSTSGMGSNRWSLSGGSRDDLNNVENVFIPTPMVGLWTVEVFGRPGDMPIPNGPQHFSLVASGARQGTPPTANLDIPNGGETWTVGTFHDIEWTMSDTEDLPSELRVTLDYSIDGGFTFPYNIITDQTGFGASGIYNWQIPNTPTTNAIVRITVENTKGYDITDVSDATFTIDMVFPIVQVTSPNGGEPLLGGGSWPITWTASAGTNPLIADPITIEYSSTGPGGPWNPIASNELNDGTYDWTPVPVIDSTNCYVRISAEDTLGFIGQDNSDASFKIDSTAPLPATGPYAELTGTNDVTIYWTPSASPDVGSYEVWYSATSWDTTGAAYTWLGTIPVGTNNFVHSNRGVNNAGSYYYQVRTYDDAGNGASTLIQAAKFGRTLGIVQSDWWMLGSCLVQTDTSLNHVIQGQGFPANWDYAMAWDANNQEWISFMKGRPASQNALSDVTNEMGFWLHTTANARFTTAGYVSDMSINLDAGWNIVPYPYAERARTTDQIEADLIANCPNYVPGSIQIFDASADYQTRSAASDTISNNEEGFWIQVTSDTVWTVMND
jgi:hypothetical protein